MSHVSGKSNWLRSLSCSRRELVSDRGDAIAQSVTMDDHSTLAVPGLGVGSWGLGLSLHQAVSALKRRMTRGERVRMEFKGEECAVCLTLPGNVQLQFSAESQLLEQITLFRPWPQGGLFLQLLARNADGKDSTSSNHPAVAADPRYIRLCGHQEDLKVVDVLNFKFPVSRAQTVDTAFPPSTDPALPALTFKGLSFSPCSEDGSVCDSISISPIAVDGNCSAARPLCGSRGMTPVCVSSIIENIPHPRCTGVQIEMLSAVRGPVASHGQATSSSINSCTADGGGDHHAVDSISVVFGDSMQSVLADLGHPDDIYQCHTTGDELHSWCLKARKQPRLFNRPASLKQSSFSPALLKRSGSSKFMSDGQAIPSLKANSDQGTEVVSDLSSKTSDSSKGSSKAGDQNGLVCFNYFDLGLDVMFHTSSRTVQQVVLHTNSPGHASFGQYARCPFRLSLMCCCLRTQLRHSSAKQAHCRSFITPSTRWSQLVAGNVCGCARTVGNVRYTGFSPEESTNMVSSTQCTVMDQYMFEVLPSQCRDGDRLLSITLLPTNPSLLCHGDYPGRPLKQVHDDVAAKLAAQAKRQEATSGLSWIGVSAASKSKPAKAKGSKSKGLEALPIATSEKDAPSDLLPVTSPAPHATSTASQVDDDKVPVGTAALPSPATKQDKWRQPAAITPRQTGTSKLRKDNSQKSRSSSELKATTATNSRRSLSQTKSQSATKMRTSSASANGNGRSHMSATDTAKLSRSRTEGSFGSKTPSGTVAPRSSQKKTATPILESGPSNMTLQQYAGAFSANAQLPRSPPQSPQAAGQPIFSTDKIARSLFPELNDCALGGPSGQEKVQVSDQQQKQSPPEQQQQRLQSQSDEKPQQQPPPPSQLQSSPTLPERQLSLPQAQQQASTQQPEQLHEKQCQPVSSPDRPQVLQPDNISPLVSHGGENTPIESGTPRTNRRSWQPSPVCDLMKDLPLEKSLREEDILLESIIHDHDDIVTALSCRSQLMQSCGNEWSTGYPHKAIGLVLDESSSTGQGGGEIADASVLVNLVEICNTEMSTSFSVDMSAKLLPAITTLLGPQQREVWVKVLTDYVSRMVDYVRREQQLDCAITRREATMDRATVRLRKHLASLHASLSESLRRNTSPISPLDSLPVAPAWRATLESADGSERSKTMDILEELLQKLSLTV